MNDIYKDYSIDDFLSDDMFVDWIIDGKNNEVWQSWVKKNPSQEKYISEASLLVKNLRFKNEQVSPSIKHAIWHRIEKSTQAKEVELPTRRYWLSGLAIAASLALITFFWLNQGQTIVNSNETLAYQEVTLPAASIIQLTPHSEVRYNERGWSTERNISLEGQAHFKVSKGVPFKVETAFGQVEVLGTEFDVHAEDGQFMVKVDEGKVQVKSGRQEHILTADMAFYKNPKDLDQEDIDQWKVEDITIVYEAQSLREVIRSLPLVTDKSIEAGGINLEEQYTGIINSSDSLEETLKQIFWPLQIRYEVEGDIIKLN